MNKFDLLRQQMRLSSPGARDQISSDQLISNLYSTGINFDDQIELRNRRRQSLLPTEMLRQRSTDERNYARLRPSLSI